MSIGDELYQWLIFSVYWLTPVSLSLAYPSIKYLSLSLKSKSATNVPGTIFVPYTSLGTDITATSVDSYLD